MNPSVPTSLVFVLWSGTTGGAESFTAALCRQLRAAGVGASILFVCDAGLLARRLEQDGVPHRSLGLRRGRHVVRVPRRLARLAAELGPDGAVLSSPGYLAGALRAGGYRNRIAAINHGRLLQQDSLPFAARVLRRADRLSGMWALDIEVAVSAHMHARLLQERFRARNVVRIYNGVDVGEFIPRPTFRARRPFTIGAAGRLIEGKGINDILKAFSLLTRREGGANLRIAGDGPRRAALQDYAASLGIQESVTFEGWVKDMPSFWNACDLAVVPPGSWVEAFGMVAVEAMACGRPVVASRNGALPEIVHDSKTGLLFEPGDIAALAAALDRYRLDEALRLAHGRNARIRCESLFSLERCAHDYLSLFASTRAAPVRAAYLHERVGPADEGECYARPVSSSRS